MILQLREVKRCGKNVPLQFDALCGILQLIVVPEASITSIEENDGLAVAESAPGSPGSHVSVSSADEGPALESVGKPKPSWEELDAILFTPQPKPRNCRRATPPKARAGPVDPAEMQALMAAPTSPPLTPGQLTAKLQGIKIAWA